MTASRGIHKNAGYLMMGALCALALAACGSSAGGGYTDSDLSGGTNSTADAGTTLNGGATVATSREPAAQISASAQVMQAQVVGRIDQVAFMNDQWTIRGWACEVGNSTPIAVDVYLGNGRSYTTRAFADQPSDPDVAEACNDKVTSKHRFTIPVAPIATRSQVTVKAGATPLAGSGVFWLPAGQGSAGVL